MHRCIVFRVFFTSLDQFAFVSFSLFVFGLISSPQSQESGRTERLRQQLFLSIGTNKKHINKTTTARLWSCDVSSAYRMQRSSAARWRVCGPRWTIHLFSFERISRRSEHNPPLLARERNQRRPCRKRHGNLPGEQRWTNNCNISAKLTLNFN